MTTDVPDPAWDTDIDAIWAADVRGVGCSACGSVHLVPHGWESPRCPNCLAESMEPQPTRLPPEPPELVVPFAPSLTPASLSPRLSEWVRAIWLRPADLRVEQLLARLRRVYQPMWLVDGEVVGVWSARMGFDYQVQSSQERFTDDGGWTSQRLTESRIRWESRVGRVRRTYQNMLVPALEEGEQAELTARLGHYDMDRAVAYTSAAIADAAVRVPSLLPEEAWPMGRFLFDRAAARDCQRGARAQHSDEFSLRADYRNLNWTQILLPGYITHYRDDDGRSLPVWINGQSGRISGVGRASQRKSLRIAGAVAATALVLFLIGLFVSLLSVDTIGSVLMTAGFTLIITAALPVVWTWQFNRKQPP